MESAIWGFIGTLIGASASLATAYLTNRTSLHMQSEAKEHERREAAKAFQRQTLLELQEAFHNAIRLATRAYLADTEAHRKGALWGRQSLPEGLSEDIRLCNRQVNLLIERVSDDGVRNSIKGLMKDLTMISFLASEQESKVALDRISTESLMVLEGLGKTLRSLY